MGGLYIGFAIPGSDTFSTGIESRRCISISRCLYYSEINWKVSTYMYVYKTVSPIVVYILQNIQTCPLLR